MEPEPETGVRIYWAARSTERRASVRVRRAARGTLSAWSANPEGSITSLVSSVTGITGATLLYT